MIPIGTFWRDSTTGPATLRTVEDPDSRTQTLRTRGGVWDVVPGGRECTNGVLHQLCVLRDPDVQRSQHLLAGDPEVGVHRGYETLVGHDR